MKNQKYVIVFTLIAAILLIMVSGVVNASSSPLNLQVEDQTPTNEANEPVNNNQPQNNAGQNNAAPNNAVPNNTVPNNTANNKTNSLPQTGVAEDTALFVFIAICVVSAIYAFVKIRNYKNV